MFCKDFVLLFLQTSDTIAYILVLSYTDTWGDWHSWEYCPTGTWVVKFQTRVEYANGPGLGNGTRVDAL